MMTGDLARLLAQHMSPPVPTPKKLPPPDDWGIVQHFSQEEMDRMPDHFWWDLLRWEMMTPEQRAMEPQWYPVEPEYKGRLGFWERSS